MNQFSDLMNHYTPEESISDTPLDPQRIKARTMRQISSATARPLHHRMGRTLLIAAVLSLLALTVAAGSFGAGDFFRDILQRKLDEDPRMETQHVLTQSQVNLVSQLGKVDGQTSESNGASLTLNAYYGDKSILHLYFHLEAPEGTVLPTAERYIFFTGTKEAEEFHLDFHEDSDFDKQKFILIAEALPDEDSSDNQMDFLITLRKDRGNLIPYYSSSQQRRFCLHGLYYQVIGENEDIYRDPFWARQDSANPGVFTFRRILDGDFLFEIEAPTISAPLEISMEGMDYTSEYAYYWSHPEGEDHTADCPPYNEYGRHKEVAGPYMVHPTKFQISPLGVDYAYWAEVPSVEYWHTMTFQVIMKDGSAAPLLQNFPKIKDSRLDTPKTKIITNRHINFTVPLDFTQIDYVLIGDSEVGTCHKIDFAQYLN